MESDKICKICGLCYADPKNAKKCTEWCSTHTSCNTELAKLAIGEEKDYEEE